MTPTPKQFAVIGHPISHSRSPAIHAAFAEQLGIQLTYGRIDSLPDAFEDNVTTFFNEGGSGLNVTVPFKERAWQMALEHLSDRARDAGAVNTLWVANDQLNGCNTDGVGLVNDLKRLGMPLQDAKILLVGAGGAARGVLGALLQAGVKRIQVVNRTPARARDLIRHWIATHPDDANRLGASGLSDNELSDRLEQRFDVIINATASSLSGDTLPLPASLFGIDVHAYDMMYGSKPTPFLEQARQGGCVSLADGLGMLVGQAAESFRIWNGQMPDVLPVIARVRAQLDDSVR